MRGHENPALDVALHLGRRWDRPVFVYHALDEEYPYASDRHHTFILEGAREVAAELARRGVGYAFHLARPGHDGPHLLTLAGQAAAVVTEEMPVPFLRRWTERVRAAAAGPLWTVDCDCIVPLPLTRAGTTDRAFRFRQATARLRRERIERDWRDAPPPEGGPWIPDDLPFDPVELADADLAALVASCRIDHSVAPVPHTRGGSRAGYARWQAFREKGLRSYHRRRNDPLKDGVSRLSPYLHYGHISPFRVAREAAAEGGDGAEKFLDELLIWRELSHAFCFHRLDPDGLEALPAWARETLTRHGGDPRPVIHSMETLERGRTGSDLWDAAQRSLLIHGELHNNVRMTWGKALLPWSRDAGEALARLLELNDRYALDGRDPNSRGGILWCLGAFDRPFDPPRPILGRVRGREVEGHARRLDVAAYTRHTTRPALDPAPRVAVVGAGMAGLAAARALTDHGLHVRILDKGRRPGGRMATRRSREGWMADHGAQFFTARDPRFARHLPSWVEAGVVAEWKGTVVRLVRTDDGVLESEPARESRRWIGTPGMQALPGHLARDLNVHLSRRVVGLAQDGRRWFLRIRDEGAEMAGKGASAPDVGSPDVEWEEGPFDAVLFTAPPPQTARLLESVAPDLAARVARVPVAPCWAAMVEVDGRVDLPFDGAFLPGPILSWISRDSSRPGR
ncbi:MAG: FAD-dependent oxidoreductase, partial [Gemmatimonadales bacterium]